MAQLSYIHETQSTFTNVDTLCLCDEIHLRFRSDTTALYTHINAFYVYVCMHVCMCVCVRVYCVCVCVGLHTRRPLHFTVESNKTMPFHIPTIELTSVRTVSALE